MTHGDSVDATPTRTSQVLMSICFFLLAAACWLAAIVLLFRMASTRPSSWLTGFDKILIASAFGFITALFFWIATRWIARIRDLRRGIVMMVLTPVVGMSAFVVAWNWPIGESLLAAIREDDVGKVRWALRFGVDANTRVYWGWHHLPGEFAIELASRSGNIDIIRMLLNHRAAVNPPPVNGTPRQSSALIAAASAGHSDAVAVLLEAGALVNYVFWDNTEARTPLAVAVAAGHFEVANQLIAAGADPHLGSCDTAAWGSGAERLKYLSALGVDLQGSLNSAALVGNVEAVRYLLAQGYNPESRNQRGGTTSQVVERRIAALERPNRQSQEQTQPRAAVQPKTQEQLKWIKRLEAYYEIRELLARKAEPAAVP